MPRRAARRRDQLLQTPSAHICIYLSQSVAKQLELVEDESHPRKLHFLDLLEADAKLVNNSSFIGRQCG
jgi:hypothetical protein